MTTTQTATTAQLKATTCLHQDVSAELSYWAPNSANAGNRGNRGNGGIRVTIRDVRSSQETPTLDTYGFEYIKHEVTGLKDLTSDKDIDELLIPATQQLVKLM